MRNIRGSILAVLLGAACGRGGGPPPAAAPPPPTPMPPPVQLYYDNGGGIRDSIRSVIRDPATLAEYWRQATSTQGDRRPPLPDLDFGRDMAILVAAGRMTPDDQIHVDSLLTRRELDPDGRRIETLTIVVRTVEGCRRFRAEAFPVEIVRARKFEGPVKWDERRETAICRDEATNPK